MTLEQILELWDTDCLVNPAALAGEALKTLQLHNKYERIYTKEKLILTKLESSLKKLRFEKWEFFTQGHTQETRKKGWTYPGVKPTTTEVKEFYLPGDADIVAASELLAIQKTKVEALESILRMIHSRNFIIDTSAKHTRFLDGENR